MLNPQVIRRSPVVFALALLAAAALLLISEGSYRQSVQILDGLGKMAVARVNIQRLHSSVLDAEASQRGYLLTGHAEYLQPYAEALKNVDESLQQLDRRYAGDDSQGVRRALAGLHELTADRLSIIAETIRLYQAGRPDTAKELVWTGMEREKTEAIRVLSAELLAHETANVTRGRASVYRTLQISRIGLTVLGAVLLMALYMYLRHRATIETHQLELKRLAEAERERLATEVKLRTAQLTELAQHLLTVREDERNRLARDLHDELGALLTSAKLDAARIKSRLAGSAPEALERLAHLVDTLNSSIALGRRIIEDLRPSTLANLGLVPALEILASEFGEHSGLTVHCALAPVKLSASAELVVYRLVQEALTNLSKHAQARKVWITLLENDGRVEVSVRDNGVGFDTRVAPISAYGLLGMRFRVEAEHGVLVVTSAPGQGTLVQVWLPASAQATPAL